MSKEITAKTRRLTDILSQLEEGPVSVQPLAEEFQVSTRTVQRDINLIQQAAMPLISPKQSVYAFAEGFSLRQVGLTAQKAALLITSFDIAKQLGRDFSDVQQEIKSYFIPTDFEGCIFGPELTDISKSSLLADLNMAAENHFILRIALKQSKKSYTVRPYKIVNIANTWYLVCADIWGSISRYAITDIASYSLRSAETAIVIQDNGNLPPISAKTFPAIAFLEWAIWKEAHKWVELAQIKTERLKNTIPSEPHTPAVPSTNRQDTTF